MPEPKKELFSDLSLGFQAHPITGNLTRKTNRDAVKQSVKSLVLTNYYERPFKSDIGCSIRYYLFENWTPVVKEQMERAIYEVIRNYEPRAKLLQVVVEDRMNYHEVGVTIVFKVVNDETPVVLDIILERVR